MACPYQHRRAKNSTPVLPFRNRPQRRVSTTAISAISSGISLLSAVAAWRRLAERTGRGRAGNLSIARSASQPVPHDVDRSLLISAIKCGRSPSHTAVNFNPSPRPALACRTTASARICPSGQRKWRLAITPTSFGLGVSINTPPTLKSRTGATSSRPSQDQ